MEDTMSIEITMTLYRRPEEEIHCPEPDHLPEHLRTHAGDLARRLDRVADCTNRLLQDGWTVGLRLYDLTFSNGAIASATQAMERLIALGINPSDCSIEVMEENHGGF